MRSFSILATVACAALSFAAPLIDVHAVVPVELEVRHDKPAAVAAPSSTPSAPATPAPQRGVPDVIQEVIVKVGPVIQPLTFITSQNATVETITPIIGEVKVILQGALTEVNSITAPVLGVAGGLVGGLLNTVLGLAGKVLSIADLAGLISFLLKVVFTALGAVLKVVATADVAVIQPLLVEVVQLVVGLIKAVLPIAGGLIGALIPLIGDVLKIADSLGVTDILAGVGLKL